MNYLGPQYRNKPFGRVDQTTGLFLLSLFYALFMVLFPWEEVKKVGIFDDFLVYAENLDARILDPRSIIERYSISNLIQYFTFEVLWDFILVSLMSLTDNNSELSLRLISFFVFFIWGLIAFKVLPFWWGLIFLINPVSVDIAMSAIRNGLAYGLFIFSIVYLRGPLKHVTFFLTPFIHSSAIVLLVLYYGLKVWYQNKVFKNKKIIFSEKIGSLLASTFPGLIAGLLIAFVSEYFLGAIGDRRALLAARSYDPSIFQASFWYLLLATQLTCSSKYLRENSFQMNLISWYLAMNLTISWSSRVWAATIPFIAISIWNLPKGKRDFILLSWLFYLVTWYLYWSNLFGWWNQ